MHEVAAVVFLFSDACLHSYLTQKNAFCERVGKGGQRNKYDSRHSRGPCLVPRYAPKFHRH